MAIATGLAGFGMSGKFFHAPFISSHPAFWLKTILERSGSSCRQTYPEVAIAADYPELIRDPGIALIVIAVPNELHYEFARMALEAGKHVVVEKPFANTVKEANDLILLSRSTGKKIFVYHNRRWDGDFLTVRKILKSKLLGEILEYEATFNRYRPVPTNKAWREELRPGSGVLYDLSPHLVDQSLQLFGIPGFVWADIRTQRRGGIVDDHFEIKLFYGPLKVTLKAGVFVAEPGPRYAIHGRSGSFVKFGLDPQEEALKQGLKPGGPQWGKEKPEYWGILHRHFGDKTERLPYETEPGNYMAFYDNVAEALVHNKPQAVKPEEGRDAIRIIELARESNLKKTVVNYIDQ